jgi:RND family efflux transporter MFP subunit
MKRSYRPILLRLTVITLTMLTACASPANTEISPATVATPTTIVEPNVSAPGTVTASAVIVPAQVSEMGFTISAPVKGVTVKEGDKVQAGQTLVVLNTPDLEYSVVDAEAALRSAQANAEIQRFRNKTRNQAGKVVYLSGPRELIEVADAKVQQAQSVLEIAQATLAQGSLLAPYDGTIVQVNVAPGEFVQSSQVVAMIGDLEHLQVETTDLSERDIPAVKLGQSATVHVEALDTDFNGKVTVVSPVADVVGGDVVYKIIVTLDEQPEGLLWGMNAEVNIITE